MEIYISDSMLWSINDKLEKSLVKDVYFLPNVSLSNIAFLTVSVEKNSLFLGYQQQQHNIKTNNLFSPLPLKMLCNIAKHVHKK